MKNKDSFIVLDTGQINVWGHKPSGQQNLLTPLYNQVLQSEYEKSSFRWLMYGMLGPLHCSERF